MADTISIEETNKIRLAIGLPALPVHGGGPSFRPPKDDDSSSEEEEHGSTLESRQAQGYDNWKKLRDEADAKAKREATKEAIKKARDTAQKFSKLQGKGLGDEDDELDTKTWLIQQKKRQKRLKREKLAKLERELAEREQSTEYTAADLAGVKVAHELDDFEEAGEQVLTLKDTTIDENEEEGDELENLDLKEKEKLNDRLELKKKKPVYNPNDVDEIGEKSLLKHYDETIDGKKRKRFTLDAQGVSAEDREASRQDASQKLKVQRISLDILKDIPTSDYIEASEVKIKKPKKKKAKTTRQKATDEDDIFPTIESSNQPQENHNAMEVDSVITNTEPAMTKSRFDDASLVDDDDLQASLATQRLAALKSRKKMKPEDIARQLREEASATPGAEQYGNDIKAEEGGLTIDETSEFVANLQRPEPAKPRKEPSKPTNSTHAKATSPSAADNEGDIDMDHDHSDSESLRTHMKRETSTPSAPNLTGTGLDEESTLNQGIGATLSMLQQRHLVASSSITDINALHRDRQKFLLEKQKREADAERKARLQRERDRLSGKLSSMSAREREEHARWENKQRDQQESRREAEVFNREYKPDIELKYVDEKGRSMNQKEAFKHLSHQFHGKGSGKQKTEKHLKKIEDAKRREATSTLDSSQATGMNNAMGTTARKNKVAGVRLA